MDRTILELFNYEIIQSFRATKEKVFEHPFMTTWFLLLLFTGFGLVLFLIEYASTLDELFIEPTRGDVLFSIFFFLFAKSSAETVDDTFRNKRLKYLITSPISSKKIIFSRLLKEIWYNLLLVAMSLLIVTFLVFTFNIQLPLDFYFIPHLYILVLLAPIAGFYMAMLTQLKDFKIKLFGIVLYGQTIPIMFYVVRTFEGAINIFFFTSVIIIVTTILILVKSDLFIEAWVNGITSDTGSSFRFHKAGDFLPIIIKESIRRVAEKEILERWRRKETPGSIGVVALIGFGLFFMYFRFGKSPDLGLDVDEYLYPLLIGMALYLGVVIQIVLPSLTLFSREGRKMWSLKVLPMDSEDIIWGKVLSMLFFSWIIIFIIALPLPMILDYSPAIVLFSIISSIVMILSFTGIGAWASVRFPNYDESNDGAPDIITMYSILMLCLLASILLLSLPVTIFQSDMFLGILALIFSADMSLLLLIILVKRSAIRFEKIQLDM
ncbi:MAG: putative ABC transporter permease subunit [Thermoplasmatota archaeon]